MLRALLLQVFFSVRSERQLVEQIDYNLLFRWFIGLGMDDAVWNHAVFSKNRDRLLTSEVAQRFFAEVNERAKKYMSDEHFTVDGTWIQAWASQKSFRAKDGSGDGDGTNFHGDKRSNTTHESTTDADARLYTKSYGQESKLAYRSNSFQLTTANVAPTEAPEIKAPGPAVARKSSITSRLVTSCGTLTWKAYISTSSRRQESSWPLPRIRPVRLPIGPVGPCSPGIHFG